MHVRICPFFKGGIPYVRLFQILSCDTFRVNSQGDPCVLYIASFKIRGPECAPVLPLSFQLGLISQNMFETIENILGDPDRMRRIGDAAKKLAAHDAVERVADICADALNP